MQWRPKKSESANQSSRRQSRPLEKRPREQRPEAEEPQTKQRKQPKLSRLHKPEDMSLEDWQIELRRQFGREQNFRLENLGEHPVFSEFEVTNPQSAEHLPRPHPRRAAGRQLLLLPRLRHQHAGHLQAHRVHAGRPWSASAAASPPCAPAFSRRTARSTCSTAPAARCASGPAATAPPSWPGWRRSYFDADGALLPEAFGRFETFLAEADRFDHELRCHDDVLAFVAEVRDAERRRQRVAEAFPRGIRSAAFKDLLKVPLYDYQREGALFAARAGRCLIGDEMGLGKTDPGHRRRRDHGPPVRRRARADRLPDLAQAPVAARDRALSPTAPSRSSAACAPRREIHFAADSFFKITNYDTVHRDLDLIAVVVARPGHPRRGPAHQELEHAHRPQRQEDRLALRHRADRHAAGESAGGAGLHRAVRRSLPPRADVPPAARAPGARRGRQGGRLPRPRPASARRWRRS